MRWPRWWFERREDELSEEMESHLAMAIHDRMARGETVKGATAAARREFGNREVVRATTRDMWGWLWLEQLAFDFLYAVRKLRLAPQFTAVAALSLAIGIGATVTMYAVVDVADFRALPYLHADRLFVLNLTMTYRTRPNGPEQRAASLVPAATAADWQRFIHSFDAMATFGSRGMYWPHDDESENLQMYSVGAGFFGLLGARPLIGRAIAPSDTNPDALGVIVLSYSFWHDRFSADRNVLGKTLEFATSDELTAPHEAYTIIGVMPEKVDFPAATQGWVAERSGSRTTGFVLARLHQGRSLAAAITELEAVTRAAPQPLGPTQSTEVRATPLRVRLRQPGSRPSESKESFAIESARGRAVRLAVVLFVLLIAVLNVGNLLLARSVARDREMAVRTALGASRGQLARQLLVEGGCLALLGGALGIALARWGIGLVGSLGSLAQLGIVPLLDGRILAFALLLTSIVAFGTSFIPVLSLVRARGISERNQSPRMSAGRARDRVQAVLLVAQIGAALTLLTGAALLGKELLRLEKQGFDFDPTNIVWFARVGDARADARRSGAWHSAQFRDDVLARLARLPGVSSVSQFEQFGDLGFYPLGEPGKAGHTLLGTLDAAVNPGFLKNLKIPLIRGRDFVDADYAMSAPVAILSTSAVERFWPGEDPLGKKVVVPPGIVKLSDRIKPESLIVTVIGVMGNPRFGSVLGPPPETLLRPSRRDVAGVSQYLVRATKDPEAMMPALRSAFMSLQGAPLHRGQYGAAQKSVIDKQLAEQKLTTHALMAFAAVALLLTTLGIHGLVAYSVAQRTREIGIRMALGAQADRVLLLVTRRSLWLAAAGIALGLAGSLALTRVLRAMLYGTSPTDPAVFTESALLLGAVVLVASYLPARHATRVDPMLALRVD